MHITARALVGALCLSVSSFTVASTVWINEFHYDNAGGDRGEFVEIAGWAGLDLTGWSLALYNGNDGKRYGTVDLVGAIPGIEGTGYGIVSVMPSSLQNGPDALALVDASDSLRQFISYEGPVTAVEGPAAGWVSHDIGLAETSSTPVGYALALVGAGSSYAEFNWAVVDEATPGAVNIDQSLSAVPLPGALPLFASATLGLVALARRRSVGRAGALSGLGSGEPFSQLDPRLTIVTAAHRSPA